MEELKSAISLIFNSKASLESYLYGVQIDSDSSDALQKELILLRNAYARFGSLSCCVFSLFADQQVIQDVNANANLQVNDEVVIGKALREFEDRLEKKIEQAIKRVADDQSEVMNRLKQKHAETEGDVEKLRVQEAKDDLEFAEVIYEIEELKKERNKEWWEKNKLQKMLNEINVAYQSNTNSFPDWFRVQMSDLSDLQSFV